MSDISSPHPEEVHRSHRAGWLRAAVLGINDGIVSTSSLMIGVSLALSSRPAVLTAGIAGLVAGACSMAMGEYVSVASQRDSELEDIAIERRSLAANPDGELQELTDIYVSRGLDPDLALKVAVQLHDHDAIAAHARDELGIDHDALARPGQAATTSALAYTLGAVVPLLTTLITPARFQILAIIVSSLIALAISGAIGAYLGGGHRVRAAARVLIGGSIALAVTALIGHLIGSKL